MSEGTIDSLQIEIEASSRKAAKQIDALRESLQKLREVTNGNSLNLGNFKKELGKIGETEVSKIEKLGKALEGLKGIKLDGKIGEAMTKIAEACDLIEQKHVDRITSFGSALTSLQGVKITGYDKLPASILNIAAAVDSITDDTITRLHRLTMALGKLQGVNVSGIGSVLGAQGRTAQKPAGGAVQTSDVVSVVGAPAYDRGSSSLLGNIKMVARELAGRAAPAMSDFRDRLKSAVNLASKLVKRFIQLPINAVKSVLNNIKKTIESIFGSIKRGFRNLWDKSIFKSLETSLKKIQGVIRSFGRVAFYRAVRTAIKYVTDQLKAGTENAYWYSKQFGDATRYISEAFDEMASAQFKMSNQLGAAWSTIIAFIEPVVIRIIDVVTKAADAVTQFFAILSGKGTYMKAVDYAHDWADAADDGTKAAKEWKNQLLGFDEINRLEEPSDSGSSGKKDKYTDYGNMFEEASVSSMFDDIREAFENGEWAKLGTLLGEKFNNLVNSIEWENIGRKVGEKLGAAITTAYNFLHTADFKNLGSKIAELLNGIGDEINFETLGRLSTRIKTSLFDMLYGLFTGLDKKQLATNLSDYILGALNEWADWLSTLEPQEIARSLKDFFGNIKYDEIKDSFINVISLAWQKAVELKDAIFDEETNEKIKNGLKSFFENMKWEEIKETLLVKLQELWGVLTEKFDEIFPPEKRQEVVDWVKFKVIEMIDMIDFAAIHNALMYKIDEAIFGEAWADKHWSKGEYAGKEIIMGMMGGVEAEKQAWEESLHANVNEPVDTAFQSCKDAYDEYQNGYNQFVNGIDVDNNTISVSTDIMRGNVVGDMHNIQSDVNGTGNSFHTMSGNSSSAMATMESNVSSSSSRIQQALKKIKDAAKKAWSALQGASDRGEANIEANGGLWTSNFALGGWPSEGEIFLARESGPEMVGTIGGRTAVATNNDIVAAIEGGVYNAMASVMSSAGSSRSGGNVVFNVNGREFMRAIWDDRNAVIAEHGVSLVTNG